jgi:hypothetical protein
MGVVGALAKKNLSSEVHLAIGSYGGDERRRMVASANAVTRPLRQLILANKRFSVHGWFRSPATAPRFVDSNAATSTRR